VTSSQDITGFLALLRREIYRFTVLPHQTLIPPLVSTALYVVIFGFALGSRIREIAGVGYVVYIFPGLVMMAVINGAYQNSMVSLFISRNEMFIQDVLVSPLSYWEMSLAYTLGGALRGFIVGGLTLAMGYALLGIRVADFGVTLFFLLISSLTYAAFGNLVGLWAQRWDHVAMTLNYIITPLVFLGGVFYSIEMLPGAWREANLLNPIFYTVNGFRQGILGITEFDTRTCALVSAGIFAVMFALSVHLFRRGYNRRA